MTHLSDFSFLQRMVSFGYLYLWYTYRVWTLDRFTCLHPNKFKQGELKSIVTMLILFMIPFQLFYDITSVKIKYEEGFANLLGRIFTKPEVMWTVADKSLVIPTEYSLCIGFSLQTGTLVLLQCFWNYLANSVAKKSFMSSKEFMFYIGWTFASFVIFPLLQYNFSREIYEPTYKEIIPEMVYGIELFIVACLGVVSHFRFKKLLSSSRNTANGRSISQKIRYFQEVNMILSTVLFGHGTLLTILSCDGLTNRKVLNIHKFSADFFICNINMCAVITWFCMILIFHPKHNLSPEALNPDEGSDDSNQPLQSGISSTNTFAQTTMITHDSHTSSDFRSIHPLSKPNTPTADTFYHPSDSGFRFGPLPVIPDHDDAIYHRDKNNSITSTAPSIATLVSRRPSNVHTRKGSLNQESAIDFFQMSVPDTSTHDIALYHRQEKKVIRPRNIHILLLSH
ncbi:uncharacterized protein B0P05DRAFT_551300 [Gilbertella persicaria]|uniref:uncharacterized protein n=1 Tax=Gilbertella persicaria TaxID=101096 RepID=UPI00221FE074|nr:uncharacterized protein B0P05DRAFT_551300 [Gilbertella persicaria]KAI8069038.1 hypothetical protein B0P05DRAFT_551300 [Gilbertella persicaria]